jgi:hypothetical protein
MPTVPVRQIPPAGGGLLVRTAAAEERDKQRRHAGRSPDRHSNSYSGRLG